MDMRVSDGVNAIVEAMLPRFSNEHKFLYVPVHADVTCYSADGGEEDVTVYRDIHFLFNRPHNYTKVFIAITGYDYRLPEDAEKFARRSWVKLTNETQHVDMNQLAWYMTSDHDSCWRTDGVDSPMFAIREDMIDQLSAEVSALNGSSCGRLGGGNASWHVSLGRLTRTIGYWHGHVIEDVRRNTERGGRANYMKLPVKLEEWAVDGI